MIGSVRRAAGCPPSRTVVLAGLLLTSAAYAAGAPPSVVVAPVTQQNIAPSSSDIGHVTTIQSVKLVPRVTAFIDSVDFKEGSLVKAGQVLLRLQNAQYQNSVMTARANLASARAALANAQLVYQRASHLNASGFEAQANLDGALATRNEDQANVLSDAAAVANAELNLSYCTITAPIDGQIGAVSLTKGNLVTPSTGTLATINQINPIRVVFSVSPDSPILVGARSGSPSTQFSLTLMLPNGKPYPEKGQITFLDNKVDSTTGTVNVYADFSNPTGVLLPGAYVNVETAIAKPEEALLVPVAAVQTDKTGKYVLVVAPDNKVAQRTVTLGQQITQDFIVKSGVALGDRVIVSGLQKVKIGEVVAPTVEPTAPAGPETPS